MKHPAEPQFLTVIARSPFHIYYEGKADSVSADNRIGSFDILPGHADFFSMLTPGQVTIDSSDSDTAITFTVSGGIMTVRDNQVMLFVNM